MKQKRELDSWDRTEDITPEEVRSLDTFKDWEDEQIEELINTLKVFCAVVYNNWTRDTKPGKVIALAIDNQQNNAA